MSAPTPPPLDSRTRDERFADLRKRIPAFVPDWEPGSSGPGAAVLQAFTALLHVAAGRLNETPRKNKLAFLDGLGIDVLSAQPARAPVVFSPIDGAGHGEVLVGTRLGAEPEDPDDTDPLYFETESAIALANASLVECATIWPAKDEWEDHRVAAMGAHAFTLFRRGSGTAFHHALYLAHASHFVFNGKARVEIRVELALGGSEKLQTVWDYWDGERWSPFQTFQDDATDEDESHDGTDGLTQSGVIRLVAACATSAARKVQNVESSWLRARLADPPPRGSGARLPELDRIQVRVTHANEVWDIQTTETISSSESLEIVLADEGGPLEDVSITFLPEGQLGQSISKATDEDGKYTYAGASSFASGGGIVFIAPTLTPDVIEVDKIFTNVELEMDVTFRPGITPEKALADGLKLDTTNTFAPFSELPRPGSVFYIRSDELFAKIGAEIDFHARASVAEETSLNDLPTLVAEYWNGRRWASLTVEGDDETSQNVLGDWFKDGGRLHFAVPSDIEPVEIDSETGWWIRIRIREGNFFGTQRVEWKDQDGKTSTITVDRVVPPYLDLFRMSFAHTTEWESCDEVFVENELLYDSRTTECAELGDGFAPFVPTSDPTPALYLGFSAPLPGGRIGLYFDVEEVPGEIEGPELRWDEWTGTEWEELHVSDETGHLALPGMVSFTWSGADSPVSANVVSAEDDAVVMMNRASAARFSPGELLYIYADEDGELLEVKEVDGATLHTKYPLSTSYSGGYLRPASLPRFGTPRAWVRARLRSDGEPRSVTIRGIHLNAVWARQAQTVENEVLGGGSGGENQTLFLREKPVLDDPIVELRELDGARAEIEWPLLLEELASCGIDESTVTLKYDSTTGALTEVWVPWAVRPSLLFSGPDDRHCIIERTLGRLRFGDGRNGRVPPAGSDNIRIRSYRSGGGARGNVSEDAIVQILGSVPAAEAVTNPRASEGGAEAESLTRVEIRGPRLLRSRSQAISADDFEALARTASPSVALARALPVTHASGRPATGWVQVIIVPHASGREPTPSYELRRRVLAYLQARCPVSVAPRISVIEPAYWRIGVNATVRAADEDETSAVLARTRTTIETFLHPLTGGPDGDGWPFGRSVYLSDLASVLEGLDGVDYLDSLRLLVGSAVQGSVVEVPRDRIVSCGTIDVLAAGGDG